MVATPPPPPTGSWDGWNGGQPPKKSKIGWIIGGMIAAAVVIVLFIVLIFAVVNKDDEKLPDPTPAPVVTTAPAVPEIPQISPSIPVFPPPIISSPSTSETVSPEMQKLGDEIKAAVEDFFTYAARAGFQTPQGAGYVLLGTAETATCGTTQLSGAATDYSAYWCPSDNKLYVEYAAYAKAKASGSLLTEAYLMHATAVGMTTANGKSSLEYKACVLGAIAEGDVNDDNITADQAVKVRDAFFKDKASESSAFTAGYNSPSAQTCAAY